MLMHAIAHGGFTDTVRESALKVDSGREKKIPCNTWDSNPRQYCAWLFGPALSQMSYCCVYVCGREGERERVEAGRVVVVVD